MSGEADRHDRTDGSGAAGLPGELSPPFETLEPKALLSPLVFSSPHSGRVYPAAFLAAARLGANALRSSEDLYVDELFGAAPEHGAPLLRAFFPRAYLDVNREPYELDPRLFGETLPDYANSRSLRVASGLGTIARVVAEAQEIYARRLTLAEGLMRIEGLYRPYHRQLDALLTRARRKFGISVLIDCHSMPSRHPVAGAHGKSESVKADIVIGDRHGASCDPRLSDLLVRSLSDKGYIVTRNKPYAGGFITQAYSAPAAGLHALQIEINRAIYADEKTFARRPRFDALKRDMDAAIGDLASGLDGFFARAPIAAE